MVGEWCPNCEGVKCMDCRTRTMHDDCQHDCPECCDPDFMPRTSPYVKPVKRLAAPAVTRDELALALNEVHEGQDDGHGHTIYFLDFCLSLEDLADHLLAKYDIRLRPERSGTDG